MSYEDILSLLQKKLAQVDLTEPNRQSSSRYVEFLIMKLEDIKLKMYQEQGHIMPHLHIDYGRQHHVASFSINPPSRIEGSLHSKYDKSIINWITANNKTLLKVWNEAQSGGSPNSLIAQLDGT